VGALLVGAVWAVVPVATSQPPTPQSIADGLLAADRAFSAASAKTNVVAGLSALFARDVMMPVPGNRFATSAAAATAALRGNPDNARSRIEWTPVRAGIAADGLHGFTFGYMALRQPNGVEVPQKYVAYWIKEPRGWRVAAYKRRPRPAGPVSMALMPPALPAAIVTTRPDAATLARYHESLDQTERAFSTEAQRIGLGPAFAKYGSEDAVNMGGPEDAAFVVGPEAIARSVSAGGPPTGSEVSWLPDKVIVASSGDVGVTFGMIRPNATGPDGKPLGGTPFFTIWRRASLSQPWRYIAE
jgi:ketosteroid isomerase-like protein